MNRVSSLAALLGAVIFGVGCSCTRGGGASVDAGHAALDGGGPSSPPLGLGQPPLGLGAPGASADGEPQSRRVRMVLRNPAPGASQDEAELFFDRPDLDTLSMKLINDTGKELELIGRGDGDTPFADSSVIDVSLPAEIFSPTDIEKIEVTDAQSAWAFTVVSGSRSKYLRLQPKEDRKLSRGEELVFTLSKVRATRKDLAMGFVTARFSNIDGLPSPETSAHLSLMSFPDGALKDLKDDLEATFESPLVFITLSVKDPQRSVLILNLKNKKKDQVLVVKPKAGPAPVFKISFPYGKRAGDLTEDVSLTKEHPETTVHSARNINVELDKVYESTWSVNSPKQGEALVWLVAPKLPENRRVLGFGAEANLGIRITDIVTTLPVGHTQMYLQHGNLAGYRDGHFTLDIQRVLRAPQILAFKATPDIVAPGGTVQLDWSGIAIDDLALDFTDEKNQVQRLTAKSGQIPLDTRTSAKKVTFTQKVQTTYRLTAYDADGGVLPEATKSLPVFVQWPKNVAVKRVWTEPPVLPLQPNQSTAVTLKWDIANITPWHQIQLQPEGRIISGDKTSAVFNVSAPTRFVVSVLEPGVTPPVASLSLDVKSLRDDLRPYLNSRRFRSSTYVSLDPCGLPEGSAQVQLTATLEFDTEGGASVFSVDYNHPYANREDSPGFGRITGAVSTSAYDVALGALSFQFEPVSWRLRPINVAPSLTPGVKTQIGNQVANELDSVRARNKWNNLNKTCVAQTIAEGYGALAGLSLQ